MHNDTPQNELIRLAEQYLIDRGLSYVKPGEIGRHKGNKIEVIFLKPEALDPDVVIDPPDMRMWVDSKTKEVTWIWQI